MEDTINLKFEAIKKISEANFKVRDLSKISMINSLSPPSVFIGSRLKYPEINVGILSPLEKDENAWIFDDAKFWAENNFQISEILQIRNSLLNSRFRTKVTDARMNKKFLEIIKDVAVASNPVEIEVELKNRIQSSTEKDKILTPLGMNVEFEKAKIIGNVSVNRHLDKIISDDEMKTSESMKILYENNFDEYSLSKILSVGVLGLKKDRRLVPTRWSITASDDIIGKQLLKKVREYKWLEDYELFYEEFMGNQYIILMFPNIWSFELFELYFPGSSWNPSEEIKASTDFEGFEGRKNYAFNTAGGYYATRLPILKYLDSIKRQASVLVIRLETPSYWAALGVWVVRESVKKALAKKIKFSSKQELIESAKGISKRKYNFDAENILKMSKLMKNINLQRNLGDWF